MLALCSRSRRPLPPLRLAIVALLSLALFAAAAPARADDEDAKLPKVVELLITANASEEPTLDNPLGPSKRNFRSKLEQIRAIAADASVAGVSLDIKSAPDYAHALDLLEELAALKAAGKKIVCYTETLTRNDAMFATLADLLVVPPSGIIALEGLLVEAMYLKELLAKLDVRFEVLHIGDFKTAYEDLALDEMSAGQRVTLEALLDEFYEQVLSTIARNRGLTREQVEGYFGDLFVDPAAAAEAGLIDAAVYHDEFDAKVEALFGGEVDVVEHYGDRTKEDVEKMLDNPFAIFALLPALLNPPEVQAPDEPYVAIVYASGAIMSGKSQQDFQGNVTQMGSDTIVEALEKTLDDEHCKAVVLRVNSPGGSALASDMIWRAIERVKASGRPVVASMGWVAGSGGYWISMGCDAIVAQPCTITGSIGVVAMLPDLSAAVKTLGINIQTVSRGPLGDELSLLKHGPTQRVKDTITHWMTQVYDEFIGKVSAGRKLPEERVRELAQGRVWTGRQAVENGLVDELGGLQDAIDLAATLGGISPGEAKLVEYPEVPNFLEQLEEAMEGAVAVAARSPVEELIERLGFGGLLATVRGAIADTRVVTAERVLAVMPLQVVVR